MHKVYVDSKLLYAREGELLSDVLIENKCDTEHICGGKDRIDLRAVLFRENK